MKNETNERASLKEPIGNATKSYSFKKGDVWLG